MAPMSLYFQYIYNQWSFAPPRWPSCTGSWTLPRCSLPSLATRLCAVRFGAKIGALKRKVSLRRIKEYYKCWMLQLLWFVTVTNINGGDGISISSTLRRPWCAAQTEPSQYCTWLNLVFSIVIVCAVPSNCDNTWKIRRHASSLLWWFVVKTLMTHPSWLPVRLSDRLSRCMENQDGLCRYDWALSVCCLCSES